MLNALHRKINKVNGDSTSELAFERRYCGEGVVTKLVRQSRARVLWEYSSGGRGGGLVDPSTCYACRRHQIQTSSTRVKKTKHSVWLLVPVTPAPSVRCQETRRSGNSMGSQPKCNR